MEDKISKEEILKAIEDGTQRAIEKEFNKPIIRSQYPLLNSSNKRKVIAQALKECREEALKR